MFFKKEKTVRIKGRINVTVFENGIHLYSVANSNANLSAIGFRSGSIHDPLGLNGMNHLVEHMMARRGARHTERDAERLFCRYMGGTHGPEINIRCDRSSVLFGHDDLRRRDYMWKCFDLCADLVKSAMLDAYGYGPRVLDSAGLKVEKAAVHNEYRLRGTDVVEEYIYDLMHWHMYKSNPARFRIDCELNDLEKVKLEQVRQFIRNRYTTKSMFIILIGPKHNEAVEKVREYFGDLPQRNPTPFDYDRSDDQPVLDGTKSIEIIRPGIRQHHIAIAFPAGNYLSNDSEALDVLTSIWEHRIEQRLREENRDFNTGIYHPEAWFPRTFTHGMIGAWFSTVGDSEYVERAIAMAIEECEKLKVDESVELEEDCEDRKAYLKDAFDQTLIWYPINLCEAIVEATCNGDPKLKHFSSYYQRLRKVTPKRIREMARQYFTTPDKFVRIVVKPLTVPQEVVDRASDEVKPYLLAINRDHEV
jgi:predicted Zn-dependent peptidase